MYYSCNKKISDSIFISTFCKHGLFASDETISETFLIDQVRHNLFWSLSTNTITIIVNSYLPLLEWFTRVNTGIGVCGPLLVHTLYPCLSQLFICCKLVHQKLFHWFSSCLPQLYRGNHGPWCVQLMYSTVPVRLHWKQWGGGWECGRTYRWGCSILVLLVFHRPFGHFFLT